MGPLITLLLFGISWRLNLLSVKEIYWAFVFELLIEYNPFRSDFTIAFGQDDYKYSVTWYVHVALWMGLFWTMVSPNALRSVIVLN